MSDSPMHFRLECLRLALSCAQTPGASYVMEDAPRTNEAVLALAAKMEAYIRGDLPAGGSDASR